MRIALLAPPLLPVPPLRYGGVERIVGVLAHGLHERGHQVTLFAPGDSRFAGTIVPTVGKGLRGVASASDPDPYYERTVSLARQQAAGFDVIHSHLDERAFALAERSATPVISTLHGRTDIDPLRSAIRDHPRARLVAISGSQRGFAPHGNWLATIHHGLEFGSLPAGPGGGGYLVFVGRMSPDKGIEQTIEIARRSGVKLLVGARVQDPVEIGLFEKEIAPAVAEGIVEFLGELDERERDRIVGAALATVMTSRWPEPFGLVAIESLAAGTPVIASRSGALPEIIADGVDGFIVDDADAGAAAVARVARLDRARIRQRALDRFSAARMLDEYEQVYAQVARSGAHSDP